MDKDGAKTMKRRNIAKTAARAHDGNEAERIIRVVGAEPGLPESAEELGQLRKGGICAALVKEMISKGL